VPAWGHFTVIIRKELVFREKQEKAKDSDFEHIECFYHYKRIHFSNGYPSPVMHEKAYESSVFPTWSASGAR
jgi:transposase InsO family protein